MLLLLLLCTSGILRGQWAVELRLLRKFSPVVWVVIMLNFYKRCRVPNAPNCIYYYYYYYYYFLFKGPILSRYYFRLLWSPLVFVDGYACHLRGQNLANAVSELLHPEHGTLYRYISVRQPSADNSSSLGSKLISSNAPHLIFQYKRQLYCRVISRCGCCSCAEESYAPTYDFYLRELLRSELAYLLTYILTRKIGVSRTIVSVIS